MMGEVCLYFCAVSEILISRRKHSNIFFKKMTGDVAVNVSYLESAKLWKIIVAYVFS